MRVPLFVPIISLFSQQSATTGQDCPATSTATTTHNMAAGGEAITTTTTTTTTSKNAKFQNPKIVNPKVNEYVLKLGFQEHPVAKELRLHTTEHPRSIMMGDPTEAAMFKVLLPAIGAQKVIEVGVYTGYSTLVMADAIGPKGKVIALDVSEEYTNIGKPFWEEAGVSDRIDLRIAPALDSMQKLLDDGQEETFDFAFIDADKPNYKHYYELLLRLIRKNGIIAIDNVLWSGKVLDPDIRDEETNALREISKIVMDDDRVEHVLLPFADGVTLVRKK